MALFRRAKIGYQTKDENSVSVKALLTSGVDASLWNARQLPVQPSLEVNGFELVKFYHGVTDFSTEGQRKGITEAQIKGRLYPAFSKLLWQKCPDAQEILIFNHGLRASSVPQTAPSSKPANVKAPVKEAHSDFSPSISPLVVKNLMPHVDPSKQRYELINLWMSVDPKSPVMKTPLAFLDAQTVAPEELVDFFTHSGKASEVTEWTGQMEPSFRTKLMPSFSDAHAWFYYPKMMNDEAVIFKQYDSSGAEAQCCIHAAADLEEIGSQPLPERQSCEVRALVVYPRTDMKAACCKIWPW